jgi:GxxExxY protein
MKDTNNEYMGAEGYSLMSASFEVHRELGGGLSEDVARQRVDGKPKVCPELSGGRLERVPFGRLKAQIYQESLELELGLRDIDFSSKAELNVYYKGHLLQKRYIPDLHVSQEIMVELKAVKALTLEHEQQLLNYMHITKKAVGYLINFGPPSVEWKRFILKEYILSDQK